MTTGTPVPGTPRDDLAAAQLGIEPVPERHRVLGFLDFFVLWADFGVGLLVLLAGSLLVPGLGFWPAMAAIALGTLVGVVLLGLAGVVGSDHAIPSMVGLRPSFGIRGSYLPSLVNVIQLVGFGAFEVIIMAQASARLATPVVGPGSYPAWALAWTVVVVLMGLGGPLVVVRQWLEKAGIWIVLATAAWMATYLVTNFDVGAALVRPGDGSLTFAQAIDLVVVMPISWLPLVADYNRFARTTRSAFWGTVSGFAVANIGFYALGVLLILVLPGSDLIGSILAIAFGAAGLALLLGDEADNAFADIYSAAISIRNVRPGWSTRWLVVGVGAIVLAIALTVDLAQYQSFLYLVGALFTPLFGVLFADYFLLRRRAYRTAELYPAGVAGARAGGAAADHPDGLAADHPVVTAADHGVGVAADHGVAVADQPNGPAAARPYGVNPVALVAWGAGIGSYLLVINLAPALGGTLPSLGVSTIAYIVLTRLARARPR